MKFNVNPDFDPCDYIPNNSKNFLGEFAFACLDNPSLLNEEMALEARLRFAEIHSSLNSRDQKVVNEVMEYIFQDLFIRCVPQKHKHLIKNSCAHIGWDQFPFLKQIKTLLH